MNDAEREIDQMLTSIDKELTNLKTAHQRPLGALDFFSLTTTINLTLPEQYGFYFREFWLDVRIEPSEVRPPIVQVGWDTPDGFIPMDLWEYQISSDYTKFSYKLYISSEDKNFASFSVNALSSQKIISISVR